MSLLTTGLLYLIPSIAEITETGYYGNIAMPEVLLDIKYKRNIVYLSSFLFFTPFYAKYICFGLSIISYFRSINKWYPYLLTGYEQ